MGIEYFHSQLFGSEGGIVGLHGEPANIGEKEVRCPHCECLIYQGCDYCPWCDRALVGEITQSRRDGESSNPFILLHRQDLTEERLNLQAGRMDAQQSNPSLEANRQDLEDEKKGEGQK